MDNTAMVEINLKLIEHKGY